MRKADWSLVATVHPDAPNGIASVVVTGKMTARDRFYADELIADFGRTAVQFRVAHTIKMSRGLRDGSTVWTSHTDHRDV